MHSTIQCIIFDFDGTLSDSNLLKQEAWFHIFSDKENVPDSLVREAMNHFEGNGTRFEIVHYICRKINKPKQEVSSFVKECTQKYDSIVQQSILGQGLFSGAYTMLKSLGEKYDIYLVSDTAHSAITQTVHALNITDLFKEVYGRKENQVAKKENVEMIMRREGLAGGQVLIVGDGHSDLRAAETLRCHFIGIANDFNNWREVGIKFPLINSVNEVPFLLGIQSS